MPGSRNDPVIAPEIEALKKELWATGVISDQFKTLIMSHVYAIAKGAYERGKEAGKDG